MNLKITLLSAAILADNVGAASGQADNVDYPTATYFTQLEPLYVFHLTHDKDPGILGSTECREYEPCYLKYERAGRSGHVRFTVINGKAKNIVPELGEGLHLSTKGPLLGRIRSFNDIPT